MINQVGLPYESNGEILAKPTVAALILGLTWSLILGVTAYGATWVLPAIKWVLIAFLQGGFLGWGLSACLKQAKLRHMGMAVLIALLCGIVSALVPHAIHYKIWVDRLTREAQVRIESDAVLAQDVREQQLQHLQENPISVINEQVLVPQTGHSGILGIFVLRLREMAPLVNAFPEFQWVIIGFWAFEAFVIVMFAVLACGKIAKLPFCEACNQWTDELTVSWTIPKATADDVVQAIAADQHAKVRQARLQANASTTLENANEHEIVRAKVFRCPNTKCPTAYAEIQSAQPNPNDQPLHWQKRLGLMHVSHPMAQILSELVVK